MGIFKKKSNEVAKDNLDVPKVIFKDLILQVKVGQWAEMLNKQRVSHYPMLAMYTYLDAEELIKKANIPNELLNLISLEFGKILESAGIDKDETCIISGLDNKNFSFNCHLAKANKDACISLRWGDPIDNLPEFSIEDDTRKSRYEYFPSYEKRPSKLLLLSNTLKRDNKTCHRYLSAYTVNFTFSDGESSLSINVGRPEYITEPGYSDYRFMLDNEEELNQYLLSLSFPLDISEVYKKIKDISLGDVSVYPEIKIEAKKNVGDDEVVTDKILLSKGNMKSFTITKNGKTVSIDKDGNWSYDSPKLWIENSNDGKVCYKLNMESLDELERSLAVNQYGDVSKEVDGVKQLTKSLFN